MDPRDASASKKVSTPTRGAGSALVSQNRTTRTTGWTSALIMRMMMMMMRKGRMIIINPNVIEITCQAVSSSMSLNMRTGRRLVETKLSK